jgi:hypothetical protein
MTVAELTRQQLDPAGSVGVRPITIAIGLGAVLYATVLTVVGWGEVGDPAFAIAAVVVLVGACWFMVFAASSYRAPFTRNTHYLVHATVLVAIVLEEAGSWGTNRFEGNDWGPACLGAVLVALGPYRPSREIASAGALSAILIGFVTLVRVDQLATPGPPLAFVIVAVAPLLALCFGASAFSYAIVHSIRRWQSKATAATANLVEEVRVGIARTVQQDRVTILNRDVVPFFAEVLAGATITAADRKRARAIADSIRSLMVAEIDRSWLETALAREVGAKEIGGGEAVDDVDRVAELMTTGQRTAIRALLIELVDFPGFQCSDLKIILRKEHAQCSGQITVRLAATDHSVRSAFEPYFAVMRAVFTELVVDVSQPTVTLRFSYEQH